MTTTPSFTPAWGQPDDFTAFRPDSPESLVDQSGRPDYAAIAEHPDFVRVRRRLIRFTVPMSALFLTWYLTYVLLAAYAHDFMSTRLTGHITVGLALGFAQFASTVVIMLLYVRFARRRIDPHTAELRQRAGAGRR